MRRLPDALISTHANTPKLTSKVELSFHNLFGARRAHGARYPASPRLVLPRCRIAPPRRAPPRSPRPALTFVCKVGNHVVEQ